MANVETNTSPLPWDPFALQSPSEAAKPLPPDDLNLPDEIENAKTIEQEVAVHKVFFKVAGLYLFPVIGQIVFIVVVILRRLGFFHKKLNAGQTVTLNAIQDLPLGITESRLRTTIANIYKVKAKGLKGRFEHDNVGLLRGKRPHTFTILDDGSVIFSVYRKVIPDGINGSIVKRSILLSGDLTKAHIVNESRMGKNEVKVSSAYTPLKVNEKGDYNVFVINKDSDLTELYPKSLSAEGSQDFIDFCFHVDYIATGAVNKLIFVGQMLGTNKSDNKVVNHVGMLRGRMRTLKDTEGKYSLITCDAEGVTNTFTESCFDIRKQLRNGQELHVVRLKRNSPQAQQLLLRFASQYALRNVNRDETCIESQYGENLVEKYQSAYPDDTSLYSRKACARSLFASRKWGSRARKHAASALADELLGHRHRTENGLNVGGFCSAFATITYQVARLRLLLGEERLKLHHQNAMGSQSYKERKKLLKTLLIEEIKVLETKHPEIFKEDPLFTRDSRWVLPATLYTLFMQRVHKITMIRPSTAA